MNQELRKIQNKETYPVKTCDVPYPIVCQYGEKERIGDLYVIVCRLESPNCQYAICANVSWERIVK